MVSKAKDDGFLARIAAPLLPEGLSLERRLKNLDELDALCLDLAARDAIVSMGGETETVSGGTEMLGEVGLFPERRGQALMRLMVDADTTMVLVLAVREFIAQLRGEARSPYEQMCGAGEGSVTPEQLAATLEGLQQGLQTIADIFLTHEALENGAAGDRDDDDLDDDDDEFEDDEDIDDDDPCPDCGCSMDCDGDCGCKCGCH